MQKCKSTLFYNTLDLMYMVQCHDIVCIKFGLWRPWQVSCWNNMRLRVVVFVCMHCSEDSFDYPDGSVLVGITREPQTRYLYSCCTLIIDTIPVHACIMYACILIFIVLSPCDFVGNFGQMLSFFDQ